MTRANKTVRFRDAPPHVRAAIRDAADRWHTTDGTALADLLPPPPVTPSPNPAPDPNSQEQP